MTKLRSSTKLAIGFFLIAGAATYGYQFLMRRAIMGEHFTPIAPGNVNLVGINAGAGFKILVANRMAQLVEASDKFNANESDTGGATTGAIKKRVPIKEMLDALKGDEKALGSFVMKVNDRDENDMWPPTRIVWTAERLTKAMNGDKIEEPKLEHDLNIKLDGTPLPILNRDSMENGIIVDYPVPVTVVIAGVPTKKIGRVQEPYKPRLMVLVEKQLVDKLVNNDMMAGYYEQAAKEILNGTVKREDVRASIKQRLSAENANALAQYPEQILRSAQVVVNDTYIKSASYHSYDTTNGKMFDLTVEMTDEGRRRLWQYSEDKIGTQLLLIFDGVAIAAPKISHELAEGELTITQLPDEGLVRDTVNAINKGKGVSTQK